TPWSGPADFMTTSNSFPVAYDLVQLGEDYGPYAAGQTWADPDVDDAARAMRLVHERPTEAALRGARAAADIASGYSALAVGSAIAERLKVVAERRGRVLAAPSARSRPR
ncbi:MAG: hypothetical protein QOD51_845, partial [Candidatus Eremiobacteraeota bacterium]|nr:hypothetical protein [Candidatus Eremiobacteraeota bacterium]